MQVGSLRGWLEGLMDDDEVAVEVAFPEVDGWKVRSYSIGVRPDEECDGDGLVLSVSVFTGDFDYGLPLQRLKEVVAEIPEEL